MKTNDLVFVHHAHGVQLYCRVSKVTKNTISLWVINGHYTLTITKAEPPEGQRDYNSAIEWFRRKLGLAR